MATIAERLQYFMHLYEEEFITLAKGGHDNGGEDGEKRLRENVVPTSRTAHILLAIACDAGAVLVHAHDRRIDHLHRRMMTGGKRIHDLSPDASLPPANKAIVTSRMRSVTLR